MVVIHYRRGEKLNAVPGDLILVKQNKLTSLVISARQRSRWSHVVCVVDDGLVEVDKHGVYRAAINKYDGVERLHIDLELSSVARSVMAQVALSHVGERFGWVPFFSMFFGQAPGRGHICSGIAGIMMASGGVELGNPRKIRPVDIARFAQEAKCSV